ncbi:glycosyltransferase [Paenibacillus sp. HN-1]|uniref:glycosyltransferase family 2 protein n=1 Tax=Paenibacillus TaxID=44249 RepID=UPI001CA8A7CD|nr:MULTISPECIES: glycosyltransferase [Paenibacillus]MBY9080281.1 glycosyltransferase [Paenibacillus sp. CGMCC 1.18879]MBY9083060.1 glycosyltransferase [Paenibacillus sinensis]
MLAKVSVLLPAYNTSQYIEEAIYSLLQQTYQDFEIIAIDDGSTDGTLDKIRAFGDSRIRVIAHPVNLGLVNTLNEGLSLCRGEYIARMDGDDYCMPQRLERQVAFMDANPHIGVVGSQAVLLGLDQVTDKPLHHEEIRCWQLFHCTLIHPTVMLRKSVLEANGIQYLYYPHAEDYEIWNRLADVTRLANLPDLLLYYRQHPGQVSNQYQGVQAVTAELIRRNQLRRLGIEPSYEEYQTHMNFCNFRIRVHDYASYSQAFAWAQKLIQANGERHQYDPETLSMVLSRCFKMSEGFG